ncbi:MAG: transglycosylase SLT domain-containing protein, partial [Candidatus Delongbacteria bacterium]|nr:transglycosylase SLT domain-containing protein [Candidatus Delongbacteria bacterium]
MTRFLTFMICVIIFTGCASRSIKKDEPIPDNEPVIIETGVISPNSSSELDSLYFLVDSLFVAQNYLYSVIDSLETELKMYESIPFIDRDFEIPDKYSFAGHDIDLKDGRLASRFEKIFKNELRAAHRYIPLSGRYFPYIEKVLKENGIHDDIKYLSIAESTLNPNATSHAGAAGIWQFMRQTAKGYGLSINDYIDERRHIHKSTEAAARLLKDNYRTLLNEGIDDWLLAVCAYNAGIGTILRDAKGQGAAEFSKMIMRSEETDLYVYRSIAIKIIFENQKKIFGKEFEMLKPFEEEYKEAELVTKGHHELKDWAKANGTTIAELCEINPWIRVSKIKRSKYTPLNKVILPPGEYKLLIPSLSEPDRILLAKAEADLLKKTTHHYVYYTVRRGDNLSTIARNHGTTISNLRALNNLSSN